MQASELEIVSIGLSDKSETLIPNIQEYIAEGFSGISEQGFEISEIPCFFLIKDGRIYAKLDLSDNIQQKIVELLQGKPMKIEPKIGNIIPSLTLCNQTLNLSNDL